MSLPKKTRRTKVPRGDLRDMAGQHLVGKSSASLAGDCGSGRGCAPYKEKNLLVGTDTQLDGLLSPGPVGPWASQDDSGRRDMHVMGRGWMTAIDDL